MKTLSFHLLIGLFLSLLFLSSPDISIAREGSHIGDKTDDAFLVYAHSFYEFLENLPEDYQEQAKFIVLKNSRTIKFTEVLNLFSKNNENTYLFDGAYLQLENGQKIFFYYQ